MAALPFELYSCNEDCDRLIDCGICRQAWDAACNAMEAAATNRQQAKCAMLPCLGYLEAECEDCVNYSLYRKP